MRWTTRALDSYVFAGGAALMEGISGGAACQRSRVLARLAKRDLPGFVALRGAILVAALGPLAIVSQAVGAVESSLVMASLVLALIVVAVPGTALFLIALALLYFRACQASGEPLADVLGQFEKEALPAGYWQQHMRDRIRLQVESSR